MKVLVIGATGGSGRATVRALLAAGHQVTAFVRRLDALTPAVGLTLQQGDVTSAADVDRAVPGHDAVVVTLGISENAALVRLRGSARTPLDVRSSGTRRVIAAMRAHGVRKLVVQSTYGVGETEGRLPWMWRLMFALILRPQIDDTAAQERLVRDSGLDWVLAQPVGLTDALEDGAPFVSPVGETKTWSVARSQVGRFLAEAAVGAEYVRRSVALSAP